MSAGNKGSTVMIQSPLAVRREGEGSAEAPAVVVLLYPPGPNLGRRFSLSAAEHVVGRLEELDIPIEADSVSRRHARFVHAAAGGWAVEDLGSTNGTWVNDARIERHVLRDGDLIRVGAAILKFLSGANIEAAYHEEIYKMSIVDGLTGVHNKRYFLEFLEREVSGAARHGLPLALVMFDIDHFKKVNDTYGHLAGDAVLKEIGRRLKPRIRREDLIARYGGEEFVCVLTKTNRQGGVTFGESLRIIVCAQTFTYEQTELPVTISVGVAELHGTEPAQELVRRADENLYAAKHGGRNRVVG